MSEYRTQNSAVTQTSAVVCPPAHAIQPVLIDRYRISRTLLAMTWWEFRAAVVLQAARVLRVRLNDLYDSYPYNPYSDVELNDALRRTIVHRHRCRCAVCRSLDETGLK